MSVSVQTKKELSKVPQRDCCRLAFLSAVINSAGNITYSLDNLKNSSIIIQTENQLLPDIIGEIIKDLFGAAAEYLGGKIIIKGDSLTNILLSTRLLSLHDQPRLKQGIDPYIIKNDCCKRTYIAATFLGCGYLSVGSGYHLEFACSSNQLQDGLIKLLAEYEIKAAKAQRGEKFLVYLKDKDMISDVLALSGAGVAVLGLNSLMAKRSIKQKIARASNCDMANLNRLVSASMEQQLAIQKLGRIDNPKLKDTAQARLDNPDLSYQQLADILGISKGALKYRLGVLVKMADQQDKS